MFRANNIVDEVVIARGSELNDSPIVFPVSADSGRVTYNRTIGNNEVNAAVGHINPGEVVIITVAVIIVHGTVVHGDGTGRVRGNHGTL